MNDDALQIVEGARPRPVRMVRRALTTARDALRPQPEPRFPGVVSQPCTAAQFATPQYRAWCDAFRATPVLHRKQWEWCYILQALDEAGVVRPGARGLGFGVGTEPITAVLAARDCEIVATDLPAGGADADAWRTTGQHAGDVAHLDRDGLCPPDEFAARVTFRPVDMNSVPDDLTGFDFTWSSCAMEHLGDLEAGLRFFAHQVECLRPGGVGVHTTEFNVASNDATVTRGHTVVYRRRDIERLVRDATRAGHGMRATFRLGDAPDDLHVDVPPWSLPHLRMAAYGFVLTSYGLVVRRGRTVNAG